jgi:hypothetical protein
MSRAEAATLCRPAKVMEIQNQLRAFGITLGPFDG